MSDQTYNGWSNYDTWNVALWIGNDEPLYRDAVHFMRRYNGETPYKDFVSEVFVYEDWNQTPDGVAWNADTLDTDELDNMMRELVEE